MSSQIIIKIYVARAIPKNNKPRPPPESVVGGEGRPTIRIYRINDECSGLVFSIFVLLSFWLCYSYIEDVN
jgi:hypothetical protein